MCSHDSGEKFGQPGASFGAQVLQEFHIDVVVTWGCRWFRLLQSSWNLHFNKWMRKTLVWHLLQKSSALHKNLAFELLVVRCFSNLDEMSGNGIGADWRMCWLGWLLSSTKLAYQCPILLAWVREVHLQRQFFPTMPASYINDTMRWSAMSRSPDSSYCFSKSWHSSSKHRVYVGRKPRGMKWQAAFCIALYCCEINTNNLSRQITAAAVILPTFSFGNICDTVTWMSNAKVCTSYRGLIVQWLRQSECRVVRTLITTYAAS